MLTEIQSRTAEVFFFSSEEARGGCDIGPSVKLRDAVSRPNRYAGKLLVDTEILRRILSELKTTEIIALVDGYKEHLSYKQTAYQVKAVEERDFFMVKTGAGMLAG